MDYNIDLPEEELLKNGWKRQNLTDNHRVHDLKEIYDELNLEMCTIRVKPDAVKGECTQCFETSCDCVVVFTRRLPA